MNLEEYLQTCKEGEISSNEMKALLSNRSMQAFMSAAAREILVAGAAVGRMNLFTDEQVKKAIEAKGRVAGMSRVLELLVESTQEPEKDDA
jgi:hypothetical protein